jgi:hypothetical protein
MKLQGYYVDQQLELKINRKFEGCHYDKQIRMWMNKRESNYEMKQKTQEENQNRKLTWKIKQWKACISTGICMMQIL